MGCHQPIVEELIVLLRVKPQLKPALDESLKKADWQGIKTLPQFYYRLDELVTLIPISSDVLPSILEFYYYIDHSDLLKGDSDFENWVIKFADDWGSFLDTPESLAGVQTFKKDPQYRIDDYYVAPGGWRSFNQFFAREVKPGKRPVAAICDDSVIVAPADANDAGAWPIEENSTVTVKRNTFTIAELLDGSPYQNEFKGGIFTHSFLNVYDYHRFHVPVRGTVKELRHIHGVSMIDVIKKADGQLEHTNRGGYQIHMMRGLMVLDSPVGLVAMIPVGMDQVSSMIMTPDVGAELVKGEEFGFFQFGGSDIVTLYQANRVKLTAEPQKHYFQGEAVGVAV